MGIGAAFATGLLKGFSDNMDKEGLRRQAMRDRFDGYQTMAVDAVLKGDATTGGLNAIRNLVQKANTEIDSMEPIGPFGARGRDVTMDMAKVQSAMKSASDYNFKIQGSNAGSFLGFSLADGKGSYNDGYAFLNEYQSMITRPEIQEKLRRDPVLAQNVQNFLAGNQQRITATELGRFLESGKNKPTSFRGPNIYGVKPNSEYKGLKIHNDIMKEMGIDTGSISGNVDLAANEVGAKKPNQQEGYTVISTTIQPVYGEDGQTITAYDIGNLQIRDEDLPFFQGVAKNLNVPFMPAEGGDMPLYEYWVGVDGNGMPIPPSKQYFNFLGMKPSQKKDALSASIQLATYPGITALDPEEGLYRLGYDEEGDKAVLDFNRTLNSTKATTFSQFVMAVAPYMTFNKEKNELQIRGYSFQDEGMTRSMYVLRKRYGDLANTSEKLSMGFLDKELQNKKTAMTALTALQTKRASMEDPEVYEAFKRSLNILFGGEGSIRDAIAKDLLGFGVVEEQTIDLDDGYLNTLQQGIEDARERGGSELAELEAMRISLAFQLARAADPSGRLSNQDVQQQLDRLGAGFLTKKDAVAKIQVVMDELSRDIDKLSVFVTYGKGSTVISPNDAKIVDAAFAVDYVRNRANALNQSPKTGGDGSQPIIADDYTIQGNGTIVDKNFDTVTDPALIEAVKKAKAPKVGT